MFIYFGIVFAYCLFCFCFVVVSFIIFCLYQCLVLSMSILRECHNLKHSSYMDIFINSKQPLHIFSHLIEYGISVNQIATCKTKSFTLQLAKHQFVFCTNCDSGRIIESFHTHFLMTIICIYLATFVGFVLSQNLHLQSKYSCNDVGISSCHLCLFLATSCFFFFLRQMASQYRKIL